jgi:hypothetical protein
MPFNILDFNLMLVLFTKNFDQKIHFFNHFQFWHFRESRVAKCKKKRILILFECLFLFTKNFDQKVRFIKHFSILELSRIETRELPKLI